MTTNQFKSSHAYWRLVRFQSYQLSQFSRLARLSQLIWFAGLPVRPFAGRQWALRAIFSNSQPATRNEIRSHELPPTAVTNTLKRQ
jgi:hypothetical protein